MNSVALQPGGDYNFKIVLKGRLPGHYHIHPFFNLKDAGQVMGPGVWLDIAGNADDFTNEVKTINGELVDMETYGLSNGIFWHVFWGVLATAWLLWWVRRPLFIARYRMLQAGMEDELVTPKDRLIGKAILIGVPVLVLAANAMTTNQYPNSHSFAGLSGPDSAAFCPGQCRCGRCRNLKSRIPGAGPRYDFHSKNQQSQRQADSNRRIYYRQCALPQ